MIQVLSRKALQFRHPSKSLVNKQAKLGESNQIMTTKLEEAFIRILPNQVTLVPDWVKSDPIFDWSVKDGTLMEIKTSSSTTVGDLQAEGQQQLQDQKNSDEAATKQKVHDDLVAKLKGMKKEELIEYASENHDLELGPAMKKEDIVAAIHEAMAKDQAA